MTKYQDFVSFQAEARLAARRQARYEARNIRMRELERKQKEEEDNNGSLNTSSHQLIQNTSSTNSNHNSIHSGKTSFSLHNTEPVCQRVSG